MKNEDDILDQNVSRLLAKAKQHTTSLDFKSRLLQRIEMLNELRIQRSRYMKKALAMVGITIVLSLLIMFALSGFEQLFIGEANQLNEIIQVFLLSIIVMLGGLILYVGNTYWEFSRNRSIA